MLKALTFRGSAVDDAHSKKHDDGWDGRRAGRRRRPRGAVGYGSGNSNGNTGDDGGLVFSGKRGSVRRRGGPTSTPSPWQSRTEASAVGLGVEDDLDRLLAAQDAMDRHRNRRRGSSRDSLDPEEASAAALEALEDVSISDASFAVRAASLAFSTGSAAEAANEVAIMAAAGQLGGSVGSLKGAEYAAGPPPRSRAAQKQKQRGGAVFGAGRQPGDLSADNDDAGAAAYQSHVSAMKAGEGSSGSSDPSGSDASAAAALRAGQSPPDADSDGRRRRSSSRQSGNGGAGRRTFSHILDTEDAVERRRSRSRDGSNSSLMGKMRGVLESDSSSSGAIGIQGKDAAFARRRRQRAKRTARLTAPQRACVALAAVACVAGAILALVLPKDSQSVAEAKAKARHAADEVGLALKVIVSGKEAAGLPVDRPASDESGNKNERDLVTGAQPSQSQPQKQQQHHPLVRGADGNFDDAVQDQAVQDGKDVRMRALEMLHQPINKVFAIFATGDGDNAATASGNPNVLPPLEAYNTAAGPDNSGIFIPTFTSRNYADVWTPVNKLDVPMYWHIPKSGGTTVQDVLGHCLNMVQASDLASHDKYLARRLRSSLDIRENKDGLRYVNVDTTTEEGLEKAKRLGLAASGRADVVITHRLHDVSAIFDYAHRGRAFALFRHPVKRAVSMFYYLQTATWEPTYDESLADMTLAEYARSDRAEENWVVRSLTNEFEEPLGTQHVQVAKEILRRKVLVGIMEAFDRSLVRFEQYFGWWDGVANDVNVLRCQRDRMARGDNRNDHPKVGPGTREFRLLADRNWADVELYHYAKDLFQEQASLV